MVVEKRSIDNYPHFSHSKINFVVSVFSVSGLLLFMMILPGSYADDSETYNWEQSMHSYSVNGHTITLTKYNRVEDTGTCLWWDGLHDVYYSRQGQRIREGTTILDQTQEFNQWHNYQFCPKSTGEWNYEHWISMPDAAPYFYKHGDELRVRVRNYGGKCFNHDPNNCWDYYDQIDTLSIPYPYVGECTPGSGVCCDDQGAFKDGNDNPCRLNEEHVLTCGYGPCAGIKTRMGNRYCSGGSVKCDGEWRPEGPWSECSGDDSKARPESCNNVDDNCDGDIDNIPTQDCGVTNEGECTLGTKKCQNGNWICNAIFPTTEKCDGKDNNCDGTDDDGFPGLGEPCTDGMGECATSGTIQCYGDYSTACYPRPPEGEDEVCGDTLDNDCDGWYDENPCVCNNGDTKECGYSDVGRCQMGTTTCINHEWSDCVGAVWPTVEQCNTLDDDCDRYHDEHTGKDCEESNQIACETAGYLWNGNACCGNDPLEHEPFGDEICDGWDNDCDGVYDNHHACPVVCSDGTMENNCSLFQPFYCAYNGDDYVGIFVSNCEICGCPSNKNCNTNTGICVTAGADVNAPKIVSFLLIPEAVLVGQDVYFDLVVKDESDIYNIDLYAAHFDNYPDEAEILAGNFQELSVHFYDDGQHGDGGAGDQHFRARYMGGFLTEGFYAFKISVSDVHLNAAEKIFSSYETTLPAYNFDLNDQTAIPPGSTSSDEGYLIATYPDITIHRGERVFPTAWTTDGLMINRTAFLKDDPINTWFGLYTNRYRQWPRDLRPAFTYREDTTLKVGWQYGFEDNATEGWVTMRIDYEVGNAEPRSQNIVLDFDGGTDVTLGGSRFNVYTFPAFQSELLDDDPEFVGQTEYMKDLIQSAFEYGYADYRVNVFSTDDSLPQGEFTTIWIAHATGVSITGRPLGRADRIDVYNENLSDNAIVFLNNFNNTIEWYDLGVDNTSDFIAQVAIHEAAHLLGLHHIANEDGIMYPYGVPVDMYSGDWGFKADDLWPNIFIAGYQDGPLKLTQAVDTR